MVEIALLRQFFWLQCRHCSLQEAAGSLQEAAAAAEGPLKRLPGDEMKLHSMVEIALLVQFFGFSAITVAAQGAAAAARGPLQPPGGRCSRLEAAPVPALKPKIGLIKQFPPYYVVSFHHY